MAISQAVELSNLKLQSLITENSAAALQYSIDKQFNKTENIIFYNMGSSYTQATLVSYLSTFETKKDITTEIKKKINILAESWENIGGNRVNYNFIRNLMKRFDELPARKGKKSVANDYKVAERILPSVLKYKEILSANKYTPINILGVEDGMNLEGKISREDFEELNADVFDNIFKSLDRVLRIGNMTLDDISQIELIGGSVRIPKVQDVLKTKIDGSKIGQHMNGDDSMAFGACFHSANFSSLFKGGKKIEFNHGPSYGIRIIISNLPEKTEENPLSLCNDDFNSTDVTEECTRKLLKNATVFNIRNLMDTQKKVGFKYDSDILIKVYQFFDEENSLNINEEDNHIMNIKIKGMKDAIKYFAESNLTAVPKVEVKFDLDRKGLLNVNAEAINYIILYLKEQTSPNGGIEYLYTPEYVEPIDQEKVNEEIRVLNETGANRTVLSMARMRRDIGKKKSQNINRLLTVEVEYIGVQPLTKEQIDVSRLKLDDLDAFDALRIKTMDARNNLESEIYKRKEWLEDSNNKKVKLNLIKSQNRK
jgi:hypoxia up-regulated 1